MKSRYIKGLASYTIVIVIINLSVAASYIGKTIEYKLVPSIISAILVLPVLVLAVLILIGNKTTKTKKVDDNQ